MNTAKNLVVLLGISLVSACGGGGSSGEPHGSADNGGNRTGSTTFANSEEFFTARVAPQMDFCRTCHVPGGVADTEEGRRFLLSSNSGDDYANTYSAWEAMGKGVESNMLIVENSDVSEPHSGGKSWPEGSGAYSDMITLLTCWDDPANCVLSAAGDLADQIPLLGSRHARHPWEQFCTDQPDDAALPADPRRLIRPGVNEGKAVFFNAYWEDCRVNLSEAEQHPKTCGEYRLRRSRGEHYIKDVLAEDSGDDQIMSAEVYNNIWQKWGLSERPERFDEMMTLRYGLNPAPFDNPYPLPGEDPKATDGGSGQLPLGYRQLKDKDGTWSGRIGVGLCHTCHGGSVGDVTDPQLIMAENNLGLGNSNFDFLMYARDISPMAGTELNELNEILPQFNPLSIAMIGVRQRGQNNAVGGFEVLNVILDMDSLALNLNPLKGFSSPSGLQDHSHPIAHGSDTPAWWNYGSRARKFFDAGVSVDSTRILLAAGPAPTDMITVDGKAFRDLIKEWDLDLSTYMLSFESPEFPGEIDIPLAEQGAILFHTKDLWAEEGNADAPRPLGGNGSCASCHGAYSPRFVNDPNYLESPALNGIAGHIAPLEVIGTDPERANFATPTLRKIWATSYWGYSDHVEGWVAPEDKDPVTEKMDDLLPRAEGSVQPPMARPVGVCEWEQDVIGYQAPPLFGTWATAPYFHNGSVPTVEAVLDSSKRSPIWQRQLQTIDGLTGFDQSLTRAYDFDALGWKHQAMACGDMPGDSMVNCNPVDEEAPTFIQMLSNFLSQTEPYAGMVSLLDPVTAPVTGSDDKRLIYDTRILGNDNGGHSFSDVLTDAERKAVIEYLKTL